uniref:Uncharacterized protein n=1 Tax=Tanacetum cinerariifolium TaxID=118510 RepID=A0A6L2M223_TANCI|nr:hypothetical protein [Tanacetum cinerariifolium]
MMHPGRLRGQLRKKLRWLKVGLLFLKTTSMVTRRRNMDFGVRFCSTSRTKQKSMVVKHTIWCAGNGRRCARSWFSFVECTITSCKEQELPKFATKSEGGSKRHKSFGSSLFTTESGDASINLNINFDDDDEDEENKERLAFIEIKRRKVKCREREVAAQEYRARQEDIRFYLQQYDHLTRDQQRMAMDEARAVIKAKYNLQY